jgi:hypothetical protein
VQQGYLRTLGSIVGIVLIVLGVLSLTYFGDPIRIMIRNFEPHRVNLMPPILGGLALVGGIALLFVSQREG